MMERCKVSNCLSIAKSKLHVLSVSEENHSGSIVDFDWWILLLACCLLLGTCRHFISIFLRNRHIQ